MVDRMTRRSFVKGAISATAWSALGAGSAYSYWESGDLIPHEQSITISALPSGFEGVRIAFLTDLHRGVFIWYIKILRQTSGVWRQIVLYGMLCTNDSHLL